MKELIFLNKQVGETPLECLERFRAVNPEYVDVKMTYAGRLDPIADGLLIVLTGDAVHRKEEFSGLDKEYICTAILGIETDTYDVLGKIQTPHPSPLPKGEGVEHILQSFIGTFNQEYPPYSSKTIDGVQMHELARQGKLDDKELPKRKVTVYDISEIEMAAVSRSDTAADIIERIKKVKGDFRQKDIIKEWECLQDDNLQIVTFKISVSSGTYIRGVVHELGKKLGTGACIWKLSRIQVGEWSLVDVQN